jgi:ABC-type polysaccharide/polyol phosphate transport system ATPase subunit
MQPLVSMRNVSIQFPIYSKGGRSLKKNLVEFATGGLIKMGEQNRVVVEALQHITLDFNEGDRIGLVGHNGAGKSTLLRVVSGIYEPTLGEITVRGRLSCLFDISVGVEGDATGYENIRMRGLLLGMTLDEIDERVEEIAEFSGLGDYLDMPLRTYSAGMMLRLAFSVATCSQPEILVMDEWIATGDKDFMDKASHRLNDIVGRAKVLLLASHNTELLKKVCNKIIVLEHGRMVDFDDAEIIAKKYEGY